MSAATEPPLSWGVIGGTSQVAVKAVLPAMARSPSARLVAVASQSAGRGSDPAAGALGDIAGAPYRSYGSYAHLLDDPEIDAVYIPLPNSLHRSWVVRAAAAGKHVLCEKPLAPTAADAAAMAAASASAGVTLLEAYVTPFHPRSAAIDTLVRSGALGALRFARAAFTSTLDRAHDHRWRSDMAGGALLDVGTYCVAPLIAAAGRPPVRVEAVATLAKSGVDASLCGWLDFGGGFAASIECSFEAPERQWLEIVGTEAAVVVDRAFTPGPHDTTFALRRRDGTAEQIVAGGADAYQPMIEHFRDVVRDGRPPLRPVADAIAVLAVLDRLRHAAGLPPVPTDTAGLAAGFDGHGRTTHDSD